MKVRWLLGANASLLAIHAHIAVDDPHAAKQMVIAIRGATHQLREFPSLGRTGTVTDT